jgi:hypothetical protein
MSPPVIAQPYQVEIWCEKSTMNDILMPLGERYGVNVVTGTGELSLTHCVRLVRRAEESGRPVRILYVSDFDPAGDSMPVAVARKIEHTLYREQHYDLDIQVRPIVLTHDQCVRYQLPRSPIKDEGRAGRFEERFGEGATELDALEALHPSELERILVREIERYYDTTLDDQVNDKANEIESELDDITQQVHEAHSEDIAEMRAEHKAVLAAIKSFKRKAAPSSCAISKKLSTPKPRMSMTSIGQNPRRVTRTTIRCSTALAAISTRSRATRNTRTNRPKPQNARSSINTHVSARSAANLSNPLAPKPEPATLPTARCFGERLIPEATANREKKNG